jgi:hypothetical protein
VSVGRGELLRRAVIRGVDQEQRVPTGQLPVVDRRSRRSARLGRGRRGGQRQRADTCDQPAQSPDS